MTLKRHLLAFILELVGQCSLYDTRIYDHLLLTFKVIHGSDLPGYLRDMIRLRSSVKDLHARVILACEKAHVWEHTTLPA